MSKRSKSNKYVLKGYEPYTKPKRKAQKPEPIVTMWNGYRMQFMLFDEWSDFR